MKLITKNLTGYTEKGRYRISFTDSECDIINGKRIITILLKFYDEYLGMWILDNLTCTNYERKEEYTATLRETIIKAEELFGIKLLKSEMKIAS